MTIQDYPNYGQSSNLDNIHQNITWGKSIPARLTAAGKGKYSPVASNAPPEGREKNRRIKIFFNPDLSRFGELLR